MPNGFHARIKENLSAGLPDQLALTLKSADNISGRDRYSDPFCNMGNLDYPFLCIFSYLNDGFTPTCPQTYVDPLFHAIYLIIGAGSALIM